MIGAKAEMNNPAAFIAEIGKKYTFGGDDGKKFEFRNIDGKNYTVTSAARTKFASAIRPNNNYLMDDHKLGSIVCDWRVTSIDGVMKVYTNEGYFKT